MSESLATAIDCASSISSTEKKGREKRKKISLRGLANNIFFSFQIWGIFNYYFFSCIGIVGREEVKNPAQQMKFSLGVR